MYSVGAIIFLADNFINDYMVDSQERSDRSLIFMVEAERHKVNWIKLFFTVIWDFQTQLATGNEQDKIVVKSKIFAKILTRKRSGINQRVN